MRLGAYKKGNVSMTREESFKLMDAWRRGKVKSGDSPDKVVFKELLRDVVETKELEDYLLEKYGETFMLQYNMLTFDEKLAKLNFEDVTEEDITDGTLRNKLFMGITRGIQNFNPCVYYLTNGYRYGIEYLEYVKDNLTKKLQHYELNNDKDAICGVNTEIGKVNAAIGMYKSKTNSKQQQGTMQ